MPAWELASAYHEQTKHHFHRYARSPGRLDWATQPDPFRRFAGAPLLALPIPVDDRSPPFPAVYRPDRLAPRPLSVETISELLFLSLAISAWKQYRDTRWALRCNPSSGNLHPTEGYLLIGPLRGLSEDAGVYHYRPDRHALEQRTRFSAALWSELLAAAPPGAFLVGLSSVHWREAWKYGERAYRYCQQDMGHAIAACAFAAATLGWHTRVAAGLSDADVSRLLGIDRTDEFHPLEREEPGPLLLVVPGPAPDGRAGTPPIAQDAIRRIAAGAWMGRPNPLSPAHVRWDLLAAVAQACARVVGPDPTPDAQPPSETAALPEWPELDLPDPPEGAWPTARQIIRQRRSATAFDGRTSIPAARFYRMLAQTLPDRRRIPWCVLGPPACVHLGLFVHRVDGIAPGLYCLVRCRADEPALRAGMRRDFAWSRPAGCPDWMPLYQLAAGDCRELATRVSCHQELAGDGVFSLGMLGRFESSLMRHGAWFYRRLHWEAGCIAHVLYLEAEAAGIRGTGMGCYFDDPVHQVFGLSGREFQSLYHFAAGAPLDDPRLTTLPAYPPPRGPDA